MVAGGTAIAVVLLVSFAGILLGADRSGRQSLDDRAVQRTAIGANVIEAYHDDLRESMLAHAELLLATDPTAAEFTAVAEMMRFRAAVLLDDAGIVLQTYPEDPDLVGVDLADRYAYLRAAVDGRPTVSGPVPSTAEQEPAVAFAVPFDTASGRRVFSAGYDVPDTPVGSFLLDSTVLVGEMLYLVDADGAILGSSEPVGSGTLAEEDDELAVVVGQSERAFIGGDGTSRFVSVQPVEGTPWRLVRVLPTEAMYAPLEEGRWIPWTLFAAFAVVGVASLVMLSTIIGQRDAEHGRARRDPLTGLANRRSMDAALARHRADGSVAPWAVLMVDVDHFKSVNDVHGHARGDEVLMAVADTIAVATGPPGIVGRWGGEEFMVILGDGALDTARETAERIRVAVADRCPGEIAVTVSIGYASSETVPADGLVDLADASLYRAKEEGRNRCTTLSPAEAFPALEAIPDRT